MAKNQFVKRRAGSFTLWLAVSFADSPLKDALAQGRHSLEKAYSLSNVPASKTAGVYKFLYSDNKFKGILYFKEYHYRSAWDFIKHTFRPSRAKRTMKAAAMLEVNGFASPEIIAMGYRRQGPFCTQTFLLTNEVADALQTYDFFNKYYSSPAAAAKKRAFIKALGRFVGLMHAKNISHGDLRLGNVLVRQNGSGWDFFLLDNERTVRYGRLPTGRRIKNLVQCNMHQSPALSRTDRLRFFKAYLAENSSLVPAWKQLALKVNKKTARRLSKF